MFLNTSDWDVEVFKKFMYQRDIISMPFLMECTTKETSFTMPNMQTIMITIRRSI